MTSRGRLDEGFGQTRDFPHSTSRQQGDECPLDRQPQCASRAIAIALERDLVGEWMSDIAHRDTRLAQKGLLEREDAQHQIDSAPNRLDPTGTPGPDGRADQMYGADTTLAQAPLQPQVEVGRVDTDEDIGWVVAEMAQQASPQ